MTGNQYLDPQPPILSMVTNDRKWSRRQKKVHRKVKTGCKACKVRRQKCDEQKPICSGCSRHSTECQYQNQQYPRPGKETAYIAKPVAKGSSESQVTKSLPVIPPPELNMCDLELLHQFITSTCVATGQLPKVTAHIQMTHPILAQAYPFVMHGILAMAATHLSRLRPSRQAYYAMLAVRHHHRALPDFQSALQNINGKNCLALMVYSKNLLWCSIATIDSFDGMKTAPETKDNWLPQWFSLLRGSCNIIEISKIWIKDGPHILPELDSNMFDPICPDNYQISTLKSHLFLLTGSTLCETVLSTLRESFARAAMHHQNTPLRNAINFWISSLPDEYIRLLQKKEPWALVVLAHFCILLHRSESVWFMKGHAMRLMLSTIEFLDTSWRLWIQWPCKKLGIQCSGLTLEL